MEESAQFDSESPRMATESMRQKLADAASWLGDVVLLAAAPKLVRPFFVGGRGGEIAAWHSRDRCVHPLRSRHRERCHLEEGASLASDRTRLETSTAVNRNTTGAYTVGFPFRSTESRHRRKVPRAGFAAVQDDIQTWASTTNHHSSGK